MAVGSCPNCKNHVLQEFVSLVEAEKKKERKKEVSYQIGVIGWKTKQKKREGVELVEEWRLSGG